MFGFYTINETHKQYSPSHIVLKCLFDMDSSIFKCLFDLGLQENIYQNVNKSTTCRRWPTCSGALKYRCFPAGPPKNRVDYVVRWYTIQTLRTCDENQFLSSCLGDRSEACIRLSEIFPWKWPAYFGSYPTSMMDLVVTSVPIPVYRFDISITPSCVCVSGN